MAGKIQKITPFLWFDNQAEEAANFYVSLFKNSKVTTVSRYSEAAAKASGRPKGSAMTVKFSLDGQEFLALNGGPLFKFTEAISFLVNCGTQDEIDELWAKLTSGGQESQCGWLKDKFGLSWQIVPANLGELIGGGGEGSKRAIEALLKMKKLDIAALKTAHSGS